MCNLVRNWQIDSWKSQHFWKSTLFIEKQKHWVKRWNVINARTFIGLPCSFSFHWKCCECFEISWNFQQQQKMNKTNRSEGSRKHWIRSLGPRNIKKKMFVAELLLFVDEKAVFLARRRHLFRIRHAPTATQVRRDAAATCARTVNSRWRAFASNGRIAGPLRCGCESLRKLRQISKNCEKPSPNRTNISWKNSSRRKFFNFKVDALWNLKFSCIEKWALL